ncbi:hypothetical protein W97_00502 [Coniosporium apollinis CBS 100218]|uniref:LYC1 C-terminal domain-containing protein n=1 Tax=Coniosporium apollinis (strain CBS 100218) TaxID=1168221 RepID=R7YHK4_CONA1|nr:uncharacterized protein W97_00502 [Coniosporium apollinis CBS 100218]EON61289.1 hypothetical protein W97_00502 [Coniosporium apollinis CBS 100218]
MGSHQSDLPDSTSPTLALVHPTEQELVQQSIKNGASWRGALSIEAYLRREDHLAQQELTRDGGITWWALVDTAAEKRSVLSGCETLRKRALLAQDGTVKDVLCHGIGSVFCPPEFRRRGYAARMMKELGNKLQTWQAEGVECLFSVLYSDIGKQFYAAHGWEPFDSSHISVHAAEKPVNGSMKPHNLPEARPLYASDLAELCSIDEQLLRKKMNGLASGGKTAVAMIPDIETIRWHHAREEFVANELYGKTPTIKGAAVGNESGKRIWCYWTRVWANSDPQQSKGNVLHILRLVVEDDAGSEDDLSNAPAIAALLAMAQSEAAKWHMAEVETWNPAKVTVAAAQLLEPGAEVVHRDAESIASLMWYGNQPVNGGHVGDMVTWLGNEKYGWC